jgi:hypothetical protein
VLASKISTGDMKEMIIEADVRFFDKRDKVVQTTLLSYRSRCQWCDFNCKETIVFW